MVLNGEDGFGMVHNRRHELICQRWSYGEWRIVRRGEYFDFYHQLDDRYTDGITGSLESALNAIDKQEKELASDG